MYFQNVHDFGHVILVRNFQRKYFWKKFYLYNKIFLNFQIYHILLLNMGLQRARNDSN